MKTLLILRHAKSSWDHPGLRDHDRPLNPRGRRDAPRLGRFMAEQDLVPDRIVSSTAVRARTTAELAAAEFGADVEIETTYDLYGASPDGYIEVAEAMGGTAERLMLVGHNPGITSLVWHLTGEGEYMPTAALAAVELDIDDWTELRSARRSRLIGLWRPKALPPG
ncbi:histidine phosphatase family protein [Candidatus Palauibacter polyketidifaciens]|uniref:SixA phosphatase family protein n=1 Tax=Candidatus Palauibacter polyketidifaciens TaxID=3056740 RepID=UPI00238EBA4A|nr:histidine phosphatase family protein [Candidatus Palauibacter polyketidifaciens]MDE2719548.1 histidine phosphatase family protein [Candidatus Palauibacter polyketidifaciens]